MDPDYKYDDPSVPWVLYVSVVGLFILVASVYIGSAIWYDFSGDEKQMRDTSGRSALLQGSIDAQRDRLATYTYRTDTDDPEVYCTTYPVEQAMHDVQAELRAGRGR